MNDYFEINSELEDYHSIFYQAWQMGTPISDESIPTACVKFNQNGKYISYHFNPEFWEGMTLKERAFIVCHESLHVILNHGARLKGKIPEIANIAADIVINEALFKPCFGFKKKDISMSNEMALIETVFPDGELPDKSFEYYYEKLKQQMEENGQLQYVKAIDCHDFLGDADSQGMVEELLRREEDNGHADKPEDVGKLDDGQVAGDVAGHQIRKVENFKRRNNKSWNKVFCKAIKYGMGDTETNQWVRKPRRMSGLNSDFMLPSDKVSHDFGKCKTPIFLYQDCSGSCTQFYERFFNTAASIPRSKFDVRFFGFDTQVYPIDIEKKEVPGGGGTSFQCIESHIQEIRKKEGIGYPAGVFVISDGEGELIEAQKPQNWNWFIINSYGSHSTYAVHNKSQWYKYEEFE